MTGDIQWLPHDGGPNPVREGETLLAYRMAGREWFDPSDAASYAWSPITHYAVTPPRREPVDWSKPLVTNTGAAAELVRGMDGDGEYRVCGDFGDGNAMHERFFRADGSHAYGLPVYVRNAPEPAADPIFAAIHAEIAKCDARRAMLVKMLEVGE